MNVKNIVARVKTILAHDGSEVLEVMTKSQIKKIKENIAYYLDLIADVEKIQEGKIYLKTKKNRTYQTIIGIQDDIDLIDAHLDNLAEVEGALEKVKEHLKGLAK